MQANSRLPVRTAPFALSITLAVAGGLYAFQMPFREYISQEGYNDFPSLPITRTRPTLSSPA
jgi:hypothetical protein